MRPRCRIVAAVSILLSTFSPAPAAGADEPAAEALRGLDAAVLPAAGELGKDPAGMLARDQRRRLVEVHRRENAAWGKVRTRAEWERFRDRRLRALRESLGRFPAPPGEVKALVTGRREGPGYRVENLVFQSRPGWVVTANLYLPAEPPTSMPAILIAHSHHNPKAQGELQDMGMTWARQGCAVLVTDMPGHGERRQHPFVDESSYPGSFRPGRQDYYFRHDAALQLHLAGESLMGWMARDLMRGLDLLLARPGVDRERVILLGAVAGGGDPAGVTAALDERVRAVAPFNFGGPQPDYAIPADAERDFYWFGVPYWESTRCLRRGAAGGFAHWVVVASVAPRRLIYAHEFSWDRERDPAWPRIRKVFDLYGAGDHLAVATGRGTLRGRPPESTHCNNIGPAHRAGIYPALQRWFQMPVPEPEWVGRHRSAAELTCLTPEAAKMFRPRPLHELVAEMGREQVVAARRELAKLPPHERVRWLRERWASLLGDVEPAGDPEVVHRSAEKRGGVRAERIVLRVGPEVAVPVLLLFPEGKERPPVVVGVAQSGKQAFLKHRSGGLADLLGAGVAVCLPDVRGTGETRPGDGRDRGSAATSRSAAELMRGGTMPGARLRDLRAVLRHLRGRGDLDGGRVALWGESFAAANPPGRRVEVPHGIDRRPDPAEPLGGLLALFGALYEDDVRAVFASGGLNGFASVLESPFVYVPHDAIVPGALTAGDLADVAAALAPRPLRLERCVNGLNREVSAEATAEAFSPAREAYRAAGATGKLRLGGDSKESAGRWLARALRGE
ncbi:MAG TPA: acetylxylan esterase [Gemmataceae bacterium]